MPLVINGRFLTRPVSGVERYGSMLLRIIAKEWPDSRVVIPGGASDEIGAFGMEVIRTGRTDGHVWEQVQLPRVLEAKDVLLSPANTGPLRVRRQVLAVHDLAVIHHPEWFDRRFAAWYGFLLPRLIRRVAQVITVSEYSATDLRQMYNLRKEHVCLVQPYASESKPSTIDHGIDRPYVLVVGSYDPRKGIDRVINWYGSLNDPAFDLVIVGRSGPAFARTVGRDMAGIRQLKAVGDVRLSALYRNAIALIQPSYFEGFGLPVLEAMDHGCPVINSDLTVFRELFGEAAIFADVNDHARMNEVIHELSIQARREERIAAGRIRAAHFSEARTTAQLHFVLDPLLGS